MTPYYADDLVTIYHGEALDTLRQLDTASIDAVVTDPPYSSGGLFRSDRTYAPDAKYRGWSQSPDGTSRRPTSEYGSFGGDNRDQRSFVYWSTLWWSEALRVTRPGGNALTFTRLPFHGLALVEKDDGLTDEERHARYMKWLRSRNAQSDA